VSPPESPLPVSDSDAPQPARSAAHSTPTVNENAAVNATSAAAGAYLRQRDKAGTTAAIFSSSSPKLLSSSCGVMALGCLLVCAVFAGNEKPEVQQEQ
jgi:hypothetical protein